MQGRTNQYFKIGTDTFATPSDRQKTGMFPLNCISSCQGQSQTTLSHTKILALLMHTKGLHRNMKTKNHHAIVLLSFLFVYMHHHCCMPSMMIYIQWKTPKYAKIVSIIYSSTLCGSLFNATILQYIVI